MLVANSQIAFAPSVYQMHQRCFDEVWSQEDITSLLSLPCTRLIINQYGFLIYSKVLDEAEIISIGVLPECRRQGHAESLLHQLIGQELPQTLSRIFLEVSVQNLPAQKLYAKLGFKTIGKRVGYYHTPTGPVDAVCMAKQITS